MKFAIAVIFTLALAMGAQSSVIPLISQLAGHGLSYTAVSGPAVAAPWVAPAAHWPAAVSVGAWPSAVAAHAPAVVAAHGAAVVAAHAPAVVAAHAAPAVVVAPVAHEGVYTAQTRGAVHTAPLSGHIQSVASINAAPAPGTI
ncbi:adult cuticle protein 1-like [Drosophila sulfurigaster albostrigata]|uniref:Adult cuticle protein 1 n=1 Tax=Drosophila albomicans TaxID=7291 RepID=A0A6P8W5W5_DROAB|nr:adult cuticle protein 1 [Drosophila albomicans]XP_060658633.1 adult cuticle protein 1-like [Drosophila nasuta]XP_062142771.1 adult cuticle protein 1-like [Drosophila sulfurigaster albostrigata]